MSIVIVVSHFVDICYWLAGKSSLDSQQQSKTRLVILCPAFLKLFPDEEGREGIRQQKLEEATRRTGEEAQQVHADTLTAAAANPFTFDEAMQVFRESIVNLSLSPDEKNNEYIMVQDRFIEYDPVKKVDRCVLCNKEANAGHKGGQIRKGERDAAP